MDVSSMQRTVVHFCCSVWISTISGDGSKFVDSLKSGCVRLWEWWYCTCWILLVRLGCNPFKKLCVRGLPELLCASALTEYYSILLLKNQLRRYAIHIPAVFSATMQQITKRPPGKGSLIVNGLVERKIGTASWWWRWQINSADK